ncbi:MAG: ABC transporter ATP-binding protein [Dermabacter sp.]|jgi:putative ABC transport system ATP-binding protein|nr:ABC transporter ATP-binding protein [Dermabacter sp.]MDU1476640.1 ABC transporter ATP-binding protein [Clostridium perfringens]
MSIIKLREICKEYGKGDGITKALKNINIEIEPGEMIAILGKSGSGKSTLLNILSCIDIPNSGEYYLEGNKVNFNNNKETAQIRNSKIGLVFQNFNLIADLTVKENVLLPISYSKNKKNFSKEVLIDLLENLEIDNLYNKRIDNLSGGEKQRVAIVRALINNPKIILADEPTGALDSENSKKVISMFKRINEKGYTVIIVTHDKEIAKECKRNIIIENGMIVLDKLV